MQLTKHTDFALRCLMYVGSLPVDRLATISEVSERFEIPRSHLMKIVNQLARLGYVETIRGAKGGMRLGKPAVEINLAQIIKDFEVRLAPVNCDEPSCLIKGKCELNRLLYKAQEAFFDALEQYTLLDLTTHSKGMAKLIAIG